MLFEKRLVDGLADGSVTVAYRQWTRLQVKPGGVYRTGRHGGPRVEAVTVRLVDPARIPKTDARRAGFPSPDALRASLRGPADAPLYRIEFRVVDDPDPRAELAATVELGDTDRAYLDGRLARFDTAASVEGPWTTAVLTLIAARPEVSARLLAPELELERLEFKRRVRLLKGLGLTISHPVGYRLSPRGEAYLAGRVPAGPEA